MTDIYIFLTQVTDQATLVYHRESSIVEESSHQIVS